MNFFLSYEMWIAVVIILIVLVLLGWYLFKDSNSDKPTKLEKFKKQSIVIPLSLTVVAPPQVLQAHHKDSNHSNKIWANKTFHSETELTKGKKVSGHYVGAKIHTPMAKKFDCRLEWPGCIGRVQNQGTCGSCWAFASVSVLGDRFCIGSCLPIHLDAGKIADWEKLWEPKDYGKDKDTAKLTNDFLYRRTAPFDLIDLPHTTKENTIASRKARNAYWKHLNIDPPLTVDGGVDHSTKLRTVACYPADEEGSTDQSRCQPYQFNKAWLKSKGFKVDNLSPEATKALKGPSSGRLGKFCGCCPLILDANSWEHIVSNADYTGINVPQPDCPPGSSCPPVDQNLLHHGFLKAFDRLDKNKDKKVTKKEFIKQRQAIAKALTGTVPSSKELEIHFNYWDTDIDHVITIADWLTSKETGPIELSVTKPLVCSASALITEPGQAAKFDFACGGNSLMNIWEYLRDWGTPSADCIGYSLQNWGDKATKTSKKEGETVKPLCADVAGTHYGSCSDYPGQRTGPILHIYRAKNAYIIEGKDAKDRVNQIQHEIAQNGPVSTGMIVYENFNQTFGKEAVGGQKFRYKDLKGKSKKEKEALITGASKHQLIYQSNGSGPKDRQGGHAIKIIGWGEFEGIEYWIIQNSWGNLWGTSGDYLGEHGLPLTQIGGGFFWIRRGTNECEIETNVVVGEADMSGITYPGAPPNPDPLAAHRFLQDQKTDISGKGMDLPRDTPGPHTPGSGLRFVEKDKSPPLLASDWARHWNSLKKKDKHAYQVGLTRFSWYWPNKNVLGTPGNQKSAKIEGTGASVEPPHVWQDHVDHLIHENKNPYQHPWRRFEYERGRPDTEQYKRLYDIGTDFGKDHFIAY